MNTLLLFITVASLGAAFISAMAVRKLKRAEQERSDARVATLMAAADAHADDLHVPAQKPLQRPAAVTTDGGWASVNGEMYWKSEDAATSERIPDLEPAIPTAPVATAASDRFFGTVQREQPSSTRFAFAAGLALIVALGGAAVVFSTSNHDRIAVPAAQTLQASPLELTSLTHSRDGSTLTINGVVRNPANGPKMEGLTAVVSLIDEHGGLISTKDVPLDYRALGPGEEAPFKITVPDPGSIARYRVSFRAGTDVVPHVDRRTDTKLASAL
jgi:hypothetical protein